MILLTLSVTLSAYYFWAVLLGLIPAAIAHNKGHGFLIWWVFGAAFFIIALPASLMLKTNAQEIEKSAISTGGRKCPHCAEIIKREAKVCRFCGRDVKPPPDSSEKGLNPVKPVASNQTNISSPRICNRLTPKAESQTNQTPLTGYFFQASQRKLAESQNFFDAANHRLDGAFSQAINGLPNFGRKFIHHFFQWCRIIRRHGCCTPKQGV
jgi:hypothetical protein